MNKKFSRIFLFIFALYGFVYLGSIAWGNLIPESINSDISILTEEEQNWLKENGPLIYAADNSAPPLRFVDESDKQYKGVVVDYINLLSLELGVNIELHPMLWEEALGSLSRAESHICDMFKSEEREEYFLFTKPIYNLRAVLAVRQNFNKSYDIKNMTLATQKGDYVNEYLLNTYPGIKLIYVDNVNSALNLLLSGKVDAVAGDEPVVFYQIRNRELETLIKIKEEPLYENEVVFAVPKSMGKLMTILNKGISEIEKTDQLERIQQKWFGISTPIVQIPDYSKKILYVIFGVGILILIVIIMMTWNYSLKKEVDRRTKEVINSKNDLQITFDGMTEYISVTDLNLNIVNINKSFLDFLGYSKEQVINKNCVKIFDFFMGVDIEKIINETIDEHKSIEKDINVNDNYYVLRTYTLKNTAGYMKNILVVIQNITKEKISEKQILQANKMAAIGELAAGMGHEIRNPLGIIRNHSYMMRDYYKDDGAVKSLNFIDAAVERANKIIDNLLEFSRLTDDNMRWINLYDLITKLLELENKALMKRNIECTLECDSDFKIYSNIESLKHILINLISNSIDGIDSNGKIFIKVYKENDEAVLTIEDNGLGIKEEEIEKIFNPFYSTKDPGKGTGLGLYIVYNEVKKLNGDISVRSIPTEKTTFRISFPDKNKGANI